MRRSIERAIKLVGFLLVVSVASTAAAQELVCSDCHGGGGGSPHNATCTNTTCATECHAKTLTAIKHPSGGGTPLVSGVRDTICSTCHNRPFDGVYHPYTINVSAGTPTSAGWIDLDDACGQCHGGGNSQETNPPAAQTPYLTKADLGMYALGMHEDRPTALFAYAIGRPNTLLVSVDASQSSCLNVCDDYDWDWGDGQAHGTGVSASHEYAAGGTYAIRLTVHDTGMGRGSVVQTINVVKPDYPPTAAGVCTLNANTWTETLTDASTDDNGVVKVTVSWGDGSVLATDSTPPFGPFTRTYTNVPPASPGYYTITQTAIDAIGQKSVRTCTAAPAYFTLGGTVRSRTGANLPSATVTARMGTTTRTAYTNASGAFSIGSLKPGTWTLTVTKSGYTFAIPAATIVLGPSSAGNVISATAP